MGIKRALLYSVFSLFLIVSFQNCGQQGTVALELQQQSKVANNDVLDISDDVSDVQPPPSSGEGGNVKDPVPEDPDDNVDIVDSDDDGNIKGPVVSCGDLLRIRLPAVGILGGNSSQLKNTRGILVVNGRENLSIDNHRGLMFLNDIGIISSVDNVRSLFTKIKAKSIQKMNNVRALSLIDAQNFGSLMNYRGLSCVAAKIGEIENYRGILEVKGNVVSIKNFRGILKVEGNVGSIENFRGILQVTGDIGKKVNVKVKIH